MADFKITDKSGIKLKTANKYVREDLAVTLTDADINNIVAENIKKDVSILGVTGTYEKPDGYIIPSGKIEITNTEEINVTNYATAQVVDSNLSAENIKEGVSILGKVGTFKGGGDTSIEDGLITGEISGDYTNDRITKIRSYSFYKCKELTSVSLPQVTSISDYSFYYCSNLTSISLPQATSIGNSAFNNCSNLTSVSFPQATSIAGSSFQGCSSLTSIDIPKVTSIGLQAFLGCSSLTSISIQYVTIINNLTFNNCSRLTSVSFLQATSIGTYVFENCYSLMKVIIRQTESVCKLKNTNAFNKCYHILGTVDSTYNPTGAKDGQIYVPDELVDSYKSETNWSAYADIIVPLSTLVE